MNSGGPMPFYFPQRNSNDNVRKARTENERLQVHLNVERMKLSKTLRDLVEYVTSNEPEDRLVHPEKDNPFKPAKPCKIL